MNSIGKYKLLDQMGVSAVGTTYRASDTFRNRELAVKVLDPAITGNEQLREQLCRDLGAAAELRHPHIVTVRDLGEVDGAIYMATELLNGSDLAHMERRAFSLADRLELMVQVCGGLAYAHSKGMPHGDIKPSNIFVTGKDATILDFGIGKCLASIVEAGGRPAALVPDYFAPEQILGKPLKARSDIFSVAVVLYELLVNKHPFPGGAGLIPREIVHSAPEPLRNLDPQIPEELEQLIARALEKDPERRLERVDELAAGLYLIAQKLRTPAAADVATAFAPLAPVIVAPPPPVPVPVEAPVAAKEVPNVSEGTIAEVPPVPASAPAPKVIAAPPQKLKRAAPAAKPSRLRLWLPYAAAGVIAFCLGLTFLSRQSIRASQTKGPTPVAVQKQSPPKVEKPVAAPIAQASAPTPPAAAAASEPAPPKPSEEQILMSEVKYLWTSGKYAQALEKVNDLLDAHPDNMEGRVWKKKIRAAQEAEAAMK